VDYSSSDALSSLGQAQASPQGQVSPQAQPRLLCSVISIVERSVIGVSFFKSRSWLSIRQTPVPRVHYSDPCACLAMAVLAQHRLRLMRILPFAILLLSCQRAESSTATSPPGENKEPSTKALEKGAEAMQDLAPVRAFDHYLNGFHVMKNDTSLHMEAHHYCKNMNEEFTQCVIFDGNSAKANLIGIEYIISEKLFEGLAEDERKLWHPHNFEILSGELVLPGVVDVAEKAALAKKLNSYGKTWHVWDTGHAGHPAAHNMPVGEPLLAWSYNGDGEISAELLDARDKRMKLDTNAKRKQRADLAKDAHPQEGVDLLKDKLKRTGAPEGVKQK
jgi:hypothetical protein